MASRTIGHLVAALILFLTCVSPLRGQSREENERACLQMVSNFIEKEGVRNPRVLEAMRSVPRHEFVPPALRVKAYADAAWPIGYQQTISPPFIVAYMTEALEPQPSDRVLEIGTGSGYQAAVLSRVAGSVYSIEIVQPLALAAQQRLKRLGYDNVNTKVGDGYLGWPEFAPFDKIIVTCSPENIPRPLIDQLKEGGRMVIPLGERYRQDFYLLEKRDGKLVRKQLMPTLFVPMTGRSEVERALKPDPLNPRICNGGFELQDGEGHPVGWYYQRQMTLTHNGAPEGHSCARFDNDDPGRTAQLLQGMAVDGRQIGTLRFQLKFRADRVVDGPEPYQRAGLQIIFSDEDRQPINDVHAVHWRGTTLWRNLHTTVAVPPAVREAVVCIGLTGATGHLLVDDIKMEASRR